MLNTTMIAKAINDANADDGGNHGQHTTTRSTSEDKELRHFNVHTSMYEQDDYNG